MAGAAAVPGLTRVLAEFVVGLEPARVPEPAWRRAEECVLDALGCALGGSREPLAEPLVRLALSQGPVAQATILGRGMQSAAAWAALANGSFIHALDYDDVHTGMIGHPSAPLLPAVLALGEWLDRGGRDALLAFVGGYEVEARVGQAINPTHYRRGWHATATVGGLAAAAAGARLLGLGVRETTWALGLAATQAGGLRQVFGTMGKPFHAGRAAMSGLVAALLARDGLTCAEAILEGPDGFGQVMTDTLDAKLLTDGLGERFAVVDTAFKRHAACGATHTAIDTLAALRAEHGVVPEAVRAIHLTVHPLAIQAAGKRAPRTGLEAKFSLAFCAALALARGRASEAEFTDAATEDPVLMRLEALTTVEADETFEYRQAMPARVRVELAGGRALEAYMDTPKGRPANPLSRAELAEKFLSLAEPVLGAEAARRVPGLVWGLREAASLRPLVDACRGRTP
jgi:2-methylcitrate dehydratase PrpD